MKESYLRQELREKGKPWGTGRPTRLTIGIGWVFSLLGGLLGVGIAWHIAYGKDKSDRTGMTYLYDDQSRAQGRQMLAVAVVMVFLWLGVRGSLTR